MLMSDGQIDPAIEKDLRASGLALSDLGAREMGNAERQATGTPQNVQGYVIPYFDIQGAPLKFYRVKLINWTPKYRQVANQQNHIYFPPGFLKALNNSSCILILEGEKKAACAVKNGFAAVAVSGVDSWRNRVVTIPKDSELGTHKNGAIVAKLPAGSEASESTQSLAEGMFDLINLSVKTNKPIVIVFDAEKGGYQKREVQIAAASLGYELRYRGMPMHNIRSFILKAPSNTPLDKVGFDDFILCKEQLHGLNAFEEQLDKCLAKTSAFPMHPNIREYVNKKLQGNRVDRRSMQTLSTAILSDMDAKGVRLRSPDDDQLYYFSRINKELTKVQFKLDHGFSASPFGIKMYRDYNLSSGDFRILQWVSSQYTGEQPLINVRPKKVMALKGDQLYYQLNGSEMIRVTSDTIEYLDNGNHDILFESEAVKDMKANDLKAQIAIRQARARELSHPENIWYEAIKTARVKESNGDRDRIILSLLYSISPWFYRWRGTQLPAEMTIGEPGSGKSSLYILRLNILQGMASLKNSPSDIRDWGSSVAATAGLHVTDNVHMLNSTLRQELSDELCRVITEPEPAIEKRKLYSDFELVKIPVECVFAITALQQPFNNADIIARSIIVELDKGEDEPEYETNWVGQQLNRFGGREGWLANQIVFQQALFKLIKEKWQNNYRAKFRLVHVEQLLMLAAEVYGMEFDWIPEYLDKNARVRTAAGDETLAGLKQFVQEHYHLDAPFTAKTISEWAKDEDDFKARIILTNSRKLGSYLSKNANKVASTCGIVQFDTYMNAQRYKIDIKKLKAMWAAEKEVAAH